LKELFFERYSAYETEGISEHGQKSKAAGLREKVKINVQTVLRSEIKGSRKEKRINFTGGEKVGVGIRSPHRVRCHRAEVARTPTRGGIGVEKEH